ncbi:MAG: phosphopantetheine-binding protein, partial [Acidobacteriota bacterium]
ILFLDELPKGLTGKLQRIGLAEKLNITVGEQEDRASKIEFIAPRTPLEEVLAGICAELLRLEQVGINDNFFQLGSDSMLATQFVSRIAELFQVQLMVNTIFEEPTIARLADFILRDSNTRARVEKVAQLLVSLIDMSDEEATGVLEKDISCREDETR